MAPDSSAKQPTNFILLVEEKLGRLSQRNRVIAEKRIMDILFEIEINEFEIGLYEVVQTNSITRITYELTYFNSTPCKSTLSKQK